MIKTANQQFLDAMVRHQTYLLRYSGFVRNRVNGILDASEGDLVDKIIAKLANAPGGLTTPVEVRRMQTLVNQIGEIRGRAWADASAGFSDEMTKLSLAESVSVAGIVQVALPVVIEVVKPSARLLRSIALSKPFQGRILSEWASSMEAEDLRRIHNAIQMGMTAGEDMNTIAKRVVGSEQLGFTDGVTNMTRAQVQAVTRTAVQHVANHSRQAWFLENNDVVTQEYFVATLDAQTTPQCRALDGQVFELGRGPVPPLHYQCRSLRVAHLDGVLAGDRPAKPFTEKQLLREYTDEHAGIAEALDGKIPKTRADLPHGTRGQFDKWSRGRVRELVGPIPAKTTYQEWLGGQSKAFQEDTLGITKAKLFRDGELKLNKFVNRNGDELSLAQLAKTEAAAFRAAGLDPADFLGE